MRRFAFAALALLLFGCAVSPVQRVLNGPLTNLTIADAASAQDVLTRSAPLLPPGDPWLPCMMTIQSVLGAVKVGPGALETVNGLLTEAARLHVLDAMLASASATPGQQSCAQIILAIQVRAAAGLTPGGALLPLR